MDLGLASVAADNDDASSRERSFSANSVENGLNKSVGSLSFRKDIVPFDHHHHHQAKSSSIAGEESPEQSSKGWVPNKSPKLSNSNNSDQAQEATMRKARVSVRARSEASMVCIHPYQMTLRVQVSYIVYTDILSDIVKTLICFLDN